MFKRISKNDAKKIIATEEKSILVDIRDIDSYESGHDAKALHLTQKNISEFMQATNKDIPIFVMCYHGNSSQSVAQYLVGEGFEQVYSIDGGYEEWKL